MFPRIVITSLFLTSGPTELESVLRNLDYNRCLFESFASIAKRLDCSGIWWDTISIPADDDLRRTAINNMHQNYQNAKYTVLNDRYQLDFEWTEDGAPCLALVLSPWLTRGWTALELIMSSTVKILFKGHTKDKLLIKDLDDDILAKDPASYTRGHWIASTIIHRLRRDIQNVSDLVAVLRPRNTSWARDRLMIATLLSGIDVDYKLQPHEITKKVMDRVAKLNPASLHHGQPTITAFGGWSWCPISLDDMPAENLGDLTEEGLVGDNTCVIDRNGILTGCWYWRPLEKQDSMAGQLIPNSYHISVILGIRGAIRRRERCILLRDNNMGGGPALIVIPVGREGEYIHVKFAGSVHEVSSRCGRFDDRFGFNWFRLGAREDAKEAKAVRFQDSPSKPKKSSSKSFSWLCGKIWMGDQERTGNLLLARETKNDGIIEGYSLKIFQRQDVETHGQRQKYRVGLLDEPLFCVWAKSGQGVNGKDSDSTIEIRRMKPENSWPPESVPAFERVYNTSHDYHSSNLFRFRNGPSRSIYPAIGPKYFIPDGKHPYRGFWIVSSPHQQPSVALFYQAYHQSLEAIALTGNKDMPRGAVHFIVKDLVQSRNTTTVKENVEDVQS
ncbi:hypothetical protein BDV95DRAFT_592456 [Massariosphaeria phaeospora]|uniref:Heterokaryon incompatibility domain-containing protein n=1 Tax=Massariosphaeria phaeospora TaxID=100035 RepID=A0A7C8MT82_9PLEO|nr:hypothetical protein BDV95DRAFT_592456 [Massariosphaeria phaeospora]